MGLVYALLVFTPVAACAAEAPKGKIELGRRLFTKIAQPLCSTCHVLKDANANGTIGPSLDELRPDAARVKTAVRDGVGVMPAYREQLCAEQIRSEERRV